MQIPQGGVKFTFSRADKGFFSKLVLIRRTEHKIYEPEKEKKKKDPVEDVDMISKMRFRHSRHTSSSTVLPTAGHIPSTPSGKAGRQSRNLLAAAHASNCCQLAQEARVKMRSKYRRFLHNQLGWEPQTDSTLITPPYSER